MAKALIVHGIANQFVGEMELHTAWYPALCDGLTRAGYKPLPKPDDCFCPFYGDVFRPAGRLGAGQSAALEDLDDATADEIALLEAVWKAATESDGSVPAPAEFGETLARAPRIAERALNALARSKYLADHIPLQFFGDLKQVVAYLNDRDMRKKILDRILPHITAATAVVIGHSLGSVIAYEALCAKPQRVRALLTLGSPLGIANVVFHKLTPPPHATGRGRWPGAVTEWTNIAAVGDIVACQKTLAPLFGETVRDVVIDSGWDAHSSTRYLNTAQAGEAIARALKAR